MDWLTGSKQAEAKRLIAQLADVTRRERAAAGFDADGRRRGTQSCRSAPAKDPALLPFVQQILAQIPSATPTLIKTLATAHPILRGRVAKFLPSGRDSRTVPALLEALNGQYFTVRSRAALALGKIGDPRAIEPLFRALKDPEDEVRIAACHALGAIKDPTTFDEITTVLLDDPKIEVRQAAAQALGNTGHPAALPYLMEGSARFLLVVRTGIRCQ